jgi:hypothetical protein
MTARRSYQAETRETPPEINRAMSEALSTDNFSTRSLETMTRHPATLYENGK